MAMELYKLLEKGVVKKMIYLLMQDYHTQSSLTRIIYPHSKSIPSTTIRTYFSFLEPFCEMKKIKSSPIIRKNDKKKYFKLVKKHRLSVKKILRETQKDKYFKLDDTILEKIEVMLFPSRVRHLIFSEKNIKKEFKLDFRAVLSKFFLEEIILSSIHGVINQNIVPENPGFEEMIGGFDLDLNKKVKNMPSDKKLSKKETEELSKEICEKITPFTKKDDYSNYFNYFIDNDLIMGLLRMNKEELGIKIIKTYISAEINSIEKDILLIIQENQNKEIVKYRETKERDFIKIVEEKRNKIFIKLKKTYEKEKIKKNLGKKGINKEMVNHLRRLSNANEFLFKINEILGVSEEKLNKVVKPLNKVIPILMEDN